MPSSTRRRIRSGRRRRETTLEGPTRSGDDTGHPFSPGATCGALMPRLFGTNGVRGVVGEDMTPELALSLGRALGTWLQEQTHWPLGAVRPRVVVGTDHRTSGRMLANATSAGLLASGCDVLDVGAAPTPAIQYEVKALEQVAAGVIITASHNPPAFNGIKFCRADGREMTPDLEEEIEEILFGERFHDAPWDLQGERFQVDGTTDRYHDGIMKVVDVERIRAGRFTVAVDTANGAGCASLPRLLTGLGCRVVTLNAQPDGTFPGHPSEPSPQHAGDVQALVGRIGAHLGVMVDGDADRAVFIDEAGTYVHGDKTLALMAARWVERNGGGKVCTPVSSSSCVEELVKAVGGEVVYTVVGSPKVAKAMVDEDAIFGGEENGGLIFPEHQYTRDAAMTVAAVLEYLAESGSPFSALVARVPRKEVVKLKIGVKDGDKQAVLDGVQAAVRAGDVPGGVVVQSIDDRDGVKVYLEGGWVLVRPSGTEPIMRIYAEADEALRAEGLAEGFRDLASGVLKQVTTGPAQTQK